MNSGLNSNNTTLVAAFRAALLHQGIVVLLSFAVLAVAWVSIREWLRPSPGHPGSGHNVSAEPAWRQLLRIGFGVLWIFDALLQAQSAMAMHLGTFWDRRLGTSGWSQAQTIKVTIPYGSSG